MWSKIFSGFKGSPQSSGETDPPDSEAVEPTTTSQTVEGDSQSSVTVEAASQDTRIVSWPSLPVHAVSMLTCASLSLFPWQITAPSSSSNDAVRDNGNPADPGPPLYVCAARSTCRFRLAILMPGVAQSNEPHSSPPVEPTSNHGQQLQPGPFPRPPLPARISHDHASAAAFGYSPYNPSMALGAGPVFMHPGAGLPYGASVPGNFGYHPGYGHNMMMGGPDMDLRFAHNVPLGHAIFLGSAFDMNALHPNSFAAPTPVYSVTVSTSGVTRIW